MNDEERGPHPERLRLTTGMLMGWIALVAVGMSVVQGDLLDWVPQGLVAWLAGVAVAATVLVIPWLDHKLQRSPESLRPPSAAGRRAVNFVAVSLLFCMASSAVLLIVLLCLILAV
jgi:hypothetical protein